MAGGRRSPHAPHTTVASPSRSVGRAASTSGSSPPAKPCTAVPSAGCTPSLRHRRPGPAAKRLRSRLRRRRPRVRRPRLRRRAPGDRPQRDRGPRGHDVRPELHGSRDSDAAGLKNQLPLRPVEPDTTFPSGVPHACFTAAFRAEPAAFTEVVHSDRPSLTPSRPRSKQTGSPKPPQPLSAITTPSTSRKCDGNDRRQASHRRRSASPSRRPYRGLSASAGARAAPPAWQPLLTGHQRPPQVTPLPSHSKGA